MAARGLSDKNVWSGLLAAYVFTMEQITDSVYYINRLWFKDNVISNYETEFIKGCIHIPIP